MYIDYIVSTIHYCCVRVEQVLTCKHRMCLDSVMQRKRYNTLANQRPIYVRILCKCLSLRSGIVNYSVFVEHHRTCISCLPGCLWRFRNFATTSENFRTSLTKILNRDKQLTLPTHISSKALTDFFVTYFGDKIKKILASLSDDSISDCSHNMQQTFEPTPFASFSPVSEES